jgi:hypothetical protein
MVKFSGCIFQGILWAKSFSTGKPGGNLTNVPALEPGYFQFVFRGHSGAVRVGDGRGPVRRSAAYFFISSSLFSV